jgi:aquaporin Z
MSGHRNTDGEDRAGPARAVETNGIAMARRLSAEVFGTFALVFVAAGADTMARLSDGAVSPAARAAAPGLMVAALVYAIGNVSGAHFNPAVSMAFTVKRLFPARWLPGYWGAQLAGAILAAAVLRLLFGDAAAAGVSTTHLGPPATLAVEIILTTLLVSVILGTADRSRIVGPEASLAVGATIVLCGLMALPVEGASMNPARSLGPALVMGDLAGLWPFVLGPVAGALVATLVVRMLHGDHDRDGPAREAARGGGD